MTPPRTRPGVLAGLAMAAAVLALGGVEVGLRLAGFDLLRGIEPRGDDPVLVYRNEPGEAWSPDIGYEVRFNRFGFREREFTDLPLPGVFRIAAVGDSFTFGLGLPAEEGWTRGLEERLGATGGRAFEVLNFGVPGYNACQEDRLVERAVLGFRPHLVLAQTFFNDGDRVRWNPPIAGHCLPDARLGERLVEWIEHGPRTGLAVVRGLRALRDRPRPGAPQGQPTGPMAYLFRHEGIHWRGYAASMGRLVARSRAAGAAVGVVLFPSPGAPTPHGGTPWICAAVASLCAELGVPFLDLHGALDPRHDARFRLSEGDFHLNAEGNARAAAAIAGFLGEQGLAPQGEGSRVPP